MSYQQPPYHHQPGYGPPPPGPPPGQEGYYGPPQPGYQQPYYGQPQPQYQQPPPAAYAPPEQQKSSGGGKGCLGSCLAMLCCCFVCEEGYSPTYDLDDIFFLHGVRIFRSARQDSGTDSAALIGPRNSFLTSRVESGFPSRDCLKGGIKF
ncbi:hypothetical protein N7462_000825 [Penicillium macrosclerotiorum]|uniref:uncharacterized protein n=1 Tax=Penicillium macrosclerotiorum TaxID=303699 RepID=UPI0025481C77|nr:uncharacterized protein N7462_000825 [Penicillium macrosclerotiorum]KAJ5698820.1 hypothetical protein N7462_000825 [Penicillium macrosclerotiorum]